MRKALQNLLMALVDTASACWPQPAPSREALQSTRLVSHRGEHDNRQVLENTLPAFRAARDAGVWGIECDIRWTADLVPVVVHDPDASRVFDDEAVISKLSFAALRERLPLIPGLAELVDEFGGNTHLMIEIKAEDYPDPARQAAILAEHLKALTPGEDYHFLALDPALFQHVSFAPPACCLPVAEFNVSAWSDAAIDRGYGGLTGHYLLLTNAIRDRHQSAGQRIGTGHIGSRNALFRELNRGVEWIFSNDAVAMQRVVQQCLAEPA